MNCKCSISALFVAPIPYMVLIFVSSQAVVATDTLLTGQSISGSATLVSENGVFELGFFSPGGIEHYFGIQYKNLISSSPAKFWLGNRIPITSFLNTSLCLDAGGELYIEELGSVLWTSNSTRNGSATAVAVLLNTGNFVVRDQLNSSNVVWQSFDDPADALLPGARLGLDNVIGANISLTLYKPPYNCTLMLDQSRKRGFIMFIDGHDYSGTFPDWMVTCRVACWCIQDDEMQRPSMRQVVHMLEAVVDVELPPIPASFKNLMDCDESGVYSVEC